MLIGASINQAPDLFCAAILGVPFVDVMCTMIDCTIPLTCIEWLRMEARGVLKRVVEANPEFINVELL